MSRPGPAPCVVIDTNVFKVAEGLYPGASVSCVAACVALAGQVERGLVVAVDTRDEIVNEYLDAFRGLGTAGIGVKLVRKLFGRRHDAGVCRRVAITPSDDPPGSYGEVPEGLRDFDTDDQKFVAVAAAEPGRPQIHTAVDREWWDRRQDFADCGIDVQFPCAGDFLDRDRGLR